MAAKEQISQMQLSDWDRPIVNWQLLQDFRYHQPQDDVFHRVLMKALSSPGGTELEASTALIEWRPHHIHSQGIPHQGLLELPMLSASDSIHPDLT